MWGLFATPCHGDARGCFDEGYSDAAACEGYRQAGQRCVELVVTKVRRQWELVLPDVKGGIGAPESTWPTHSIYDTKETCDAARDRLYLDRAGAAQAPKPARDAQRLAGLALASRCRAKGDAGGYWLLEVERVVAPVGGEMPNEALGHVTTMGLFSTFMRCGLEIGRWFEYLAHQRIAMTFAEPIPGAEAALGRMTSDYDWRCVEVNVTVK